MALPTRDGLPLPGPDASRRCRRSASQPAVRQCAGAAPRAVEEDLLVNWSVADRIRVAVTTAQARTGAGRVLPILTGAAARPTAYGRWRRPGRAFVCHAQAPPSCLCEAGVAAEDLRCVRRPCRGGVRPAWSFATCPHSSSRSNCAQVRAWRGTENSSRRNVLRCLVARSACI